MTTERAAEELIDWCERQATRNRAWSDGVMFERIATRLRALSTPPGDVEGLITKLRDLAKCEADFSRAGLPCPVQSEAIDVDALCNEAATALASLSASRDEVIEECAGIAKAEAEHEAAASLRALSAGRENVSSHRT